MLKIQSIIKKHGVKLKNLARRIQQTSGDPFSVPAISRLINHGEWPKNTPKTEVKRQAEAVLRAAGATPEEIQRAWDTVAAKPPGEQSKTGEEQDMSKASLSQAAAVKFGIRGGGNPFYDEMHDSADVFLSQNHEYAFESMKYCAKNAGFMALIGECGAGKTTMLRELEENYRNFKGSERPPILVRPRAMILEDHRQDKKRVTAATIVDAIITDVSGQTPKRGGEAKSRQCLKIIRECDQKICLVIDDAHLIHKQTLKSLKRIRDESTPGFSPRLGVILIGQPELARVLTNANAEVREVAYRCEQAVLAPLEPLDVLDYLTQKCSRAGLPLAKIADETVADAIVEKLTSRDKQRESYPLAVNNLMVAAMNLCATDAFSGPYSRVCAEIVRNVQ